MSLSIEIPDPHDIFLHMGFIYKLEDTVASNGKYRGRENQQVRKSPQPTRWAKRPMNWFMLDEAFGHSCTSEFLPSVNKEGLLAQSPEQQRWQAAAGRG